VSKSKYAQKLAANTHTSGDSMDDLLLYVKKSIQIFSQSVFLIGAAPGPCEVIEALMGRVSVTSSS
jgi:hypothetical protein